MRKSGLYVGVASVALAAASLLMMDAAAAQTATTAPVGSSASAVQTETSVPAAGGQAPGTATPGSTVDEVIVTGTSAARTQLNTPMQATTINSDRLTMLNANSAADILSTIPTLKAEGGGGEVAVNVFVAGLPSGGQYQFTPLEFNGIPVIAQIGLNSSAPDIYERPDMGVERLEFVHGGVSNLFGGGSVGGLINYIDKTGGDTNQGEARVEVGNMDRVRVDFADSGPINKDAGLYYALSAFYRYDDGPLVTGMPTRGFQIRGNIKKEWANGSFTVYGQYIDDKDQFYGDYPLNGSDHSRPIGNNGQTIYTTETSQLEKITFNTPDGEWQTKVGDGAAVNGGQVGVKFDHDFGDGWGVNGRGNVGHYDTSFALFAGGDNVQNLPTTQAAFLQAYGYDPALYTGKFSYAGSGAAVPGSNLLWGDRVIDRIRPLTTASLELNLTKEIQSGGWDHHLTLGGFFGYDKARDFDVGFGYIGDFANDPQLINVSVTNNATGAQTVVSENGLLHPGLQYTNNYAQTQRYAAYFADQASYGKWEFDLGGRVETEYGEIAREGSASFTTDTTPGISPLLANVLWGNGVFLRGDVSTTAWALAGSVLYRIDDFTSVFINASRGFFFPQMNSVQINATGVQTFRPEVIKQVEGGVKFNRGRISGSAAAFYNTLGDLQNVQLLNGPPGGGVQELVNQVATRSYGVEGALRFMLVEGLTFDGNMTYENDKYTQYTPISACIDCVGNTLVRQPNWMFNAGLYFNRHNIDAAIYDSYTGRTFTSDLNNIELPPFHIVRLDVGYTMPFRDNPLRAGISVYNLFDTAAVTEGSPRLGTLQNAGQAFFVGRPVLPRRVTFNLSYKF